MKMIIILAIIGILSIGLVSAISLNFPDGNVVDYYSDIPINVSSSFGNISVYVGNGSYDNEHNLICSFSSSGTYLCNFTAYRGISSLFNTAQSLYTFGDGSLTLGQDSGTSPKTCSSVYSSTESENYGILMSAGNFTLDHSGLSCGDVRDSLFSGNFWMCTWAKLPSSLGGLDSPYVSSKFFWKNDDRPAFQIQPTSKRTVLSSWYTTVSPSQSLGGTSPWWEYDQWMWACVKHDTSDMSYIYGNGILQASAQTYTSYSPGSVEYIGTEGSVTPSRNTHGYMDEFLIGSGDITEEDLAEMYSFLDGYYCVYVNDSNGDSTESCFIKDLINPTINFNDPIGIQDNISIPINISCQDANNITLEIYIDSILNQSSTENNTLQNFSYVVDLAAGSHNLTAVCTDIVNRTTSYTKIFDVSNIIEYQMYAPDSTVEFNYFSQELEWLRRFFI